MTSTTVYAEILCKVDTSRGAPMGRINRDGDIGTKRVYNRRVYLRDGYDKGGVYWGEGEPLYVRFTLDQSYINFYRCD